MATLGQLPAELLYDIEDYLTMQDIAVLRQVSRDVSAKISHEPSFAAALHSKTRSVEFSARSLELFAAMTRPGRPGGALEALVLVGVPPATDRRGVCERDGPPPTLPAVPRFVPDDPMPADESERCLDHLARALGNLGAHGACRGLRSLALTVDLRGVAAPAADWPSVWAAAACGGSGSLDLFTRPSWCSLAVGDFRAEKLRSPLPLLTLGGVTQLHVSLSGDAVDGSALPEPPAEEILEEEEAAPPHARQAEGLARFFAAFRSADDFKLHWYNTSTLDMEFSLQGLTCDGAALLDFLPGLPGLRELEMYYVSIRRFPPRDAGAGVGVDEQPSSTLSSSSSSPSSSTSADVRQAFRPIFDWLTRADTRLPYLRLEDLQDLQEEAPALLAFRHEPDDEVDDSDQWGEFRLIRRGEKTTRPINYANMPSLPRGFGQICWFRRRRLKFGPPAEGRGSFADPRDDTY
ncbi:hypothetical protein DL762_001113 [Monosporascus cannonballus]|uniref:F-box domain-containing protein n=1 Tax=Monosporascus cannonballus TaxID=155416 RepID=A0ABY0HLH0_9PEZI|nr:hypothetical protein DL762_001113 [Monosporascus cannonballus]